MALSTAHLAVVLVCITMMPIGLLIASMNVGLTQHSKPQLQVANVFSPHATQTITKNEERFESVDGRVERLAQQVAEHAADIVANRVAQVADDIVHQAMNHVANARQLQVCATVGSGVGSGKGGTEEEDMEGEAEEESGKGSEGRFGVPKASRRTLASHKG